MCDVGRLDYLSEGWVAKGLSACGRGPRRPAFDTTGEQLGESEVLGALRA